MIIECRFIKPNGLKCGSPALRGSPFCYFHARSRSVTRRTRSGENAILLPPLTSLAAIHEALNAVFLALGSGAINSKRAGSLLYALQIAQKNIESLPPPPKRPAQPTHSPCNLSEPGAPS
jgi:hypothetical protein